MCTSIIEIARAEGMAKRGDEWFPLSQAVVAYDHARHAPLGDVITLDFINTGLDPGARAGIELTLDTAKELRAALNRAIAAAEFEEAEVRAREHRGQRAHRRSLRCSLPCYSAERVPGMLTHVNPHGSAFRVFIRDPVGAWASQRCCSVFRCDDSPRGCHCVLAHTVSPGFI